MKFPSGNRRITLVVSPVDLRSGYLSLSAIARAALGIDVESGKEIVVFISRRRTSCKVIWCDERGSATLVRGLHAGRFEAFLARAEGPSTKRFTAADLEKFLDGEPIYVKRSGILA